MTVASMTARSSIPMGHATRKRGQGTDKSALDVGAAVSAFLRSRYPSKTAELVAADTGFAASTIRKMLERHTKPNFDLTLAMLGAYGPQFLAAVYPGQLDWLNDANAQAERDALRRQLEALNERLSSL